MLLRVTTLYYDYVYVLRCVFCSCTAGKSLTTFLLYLTHSYDIFAVVILLATVILLWFLPRDAAMLAWSWES